jgi:hypothetical protein
MFQLLTQALLEFLTWKSVDLIWRAMPKNRLDPAYKNRRDDAVYKRNLQRLIEHHRQFEKKQ